MPNLINCSGFGRRNFFKEEDEAALGGDCRNLAAKNCLTGKRRLGIITESHKKVKLVAVVEKRFSIEYPAGVDNL
jgi:hypothetical protein